MPFSTTNQTQRRVMQHDVFTSRGNAYTARAKIVYKNEKKDHRRHYQVLSV